MKTAFFVIVLLSLNRAFCQNGVNDNDSIINKKIKAIYEYLYADTTDKLSLNLGSKINLWPIYVNINFEDAAIGDSIKKAFNFFTTDKNTDTSIHNNVNFKDSGIANIFTDYKKVKAGLTLFLSFPTTHVFVCLLKDVSFPNSNKCLLVFDFENDKIVKSYVTCRIP